MAIGQSNSDGGVAVKPAEISGVTGLLVGLGPEAGTHPAHQRLAATLRQQVTTGRLRPGDRLPASRILAEELGVSRWVVTEAYDQLKAEGYLTARVGSGTVIAGGPPRPSPGSARGLRTAERSRPTGTAVPAVDLSPALPDLTSFPRSHWRAAVTRALATATDPELGYPEPYGSPAFRRTMADYVRRVRGVQVGPEQIYVTPGVRSAAALVCRLLARRGATRIAVEDPTWPRMRDLARHSGLEVIPVPVDAHGMQVQTLAELDVDAAFVTPTHQFPSGVPLSAERRVRLIAWAAAGNRLIVEDDYDAEFRYDRRPVGALAALSGEHVVYLGSVSKTLSPGLHLGWMVAPGWLREDLAATGETDGALVPTLDQLALVHLIESGGYDRHLRRMRRHYHGRRTALLRALTAQLPGEAAASMDAGLHVLWLLPPRTDEPQVLAACRRAGIGVLGLSQCRVGPGRPGLVLGYGNLAEHRAREVVAALALALGRAQRTVT